MEYFNTTDTINMQFSISLNEECEVQERIGSMEFIDEEGNGRESAR